MANLKVRDVMDVMEELAPISLAQSYDNVGLLIGSESEVVNKVILGLELTDSLLEEAILKECDLIIVHHPLIFKPLKKIISQDVIGSKVIKLIKENISLYVAHTNLDTTLGGLNDYVASKLGIQVDTIKVDDEIPNIRVGSIKEMTMLDLAKHVKSSLDLDYLHYCGDEKTLVSRVGLCTGSGMSFYKEAMSKEVDVFITGDMKYHDATLSVDMKVPIIDATHYGSEILVSEFLYSELNKSFKGNIEFVVHELYDNPIKTI